MRVEALVLAVALAGPGCIRSKARGPDAGAIPPDTRVRQENPDAGDGAPDGGATAPDASRVWRAHSLDTMFELTQRELPEGGCLVECTTPVRPGLVEWTVRRCVANEHQVLLMADDGRRFLVVDVFPVYDLTVGLETEVAWLYDADRQVRAFRLREFVQDRVKLILRGKNVQWLHGDDSLFEGFRPKVGSCGALLSLVDGTSVTVCFDGTLVGSDGKGCSREPKVITAAPPQQALPEVILVPRPASPR